MTELDREEMLLALECLEGEKDALLREIKDYKISLLSAESEALDWEEKWYECKETLEILRDYLDTMRKEWNGEICTKFGCSPIDGCCSICGRDISP